jgi:hypothetical protein
LKDLLQMAQAPLSAVKEDGAMLNVRLEWTCRVDSRDECTSPHIEVLRLDEGKVITPPLLPI